MFGIGMPELILILVIGLIVFGPGKLPEMGRMLGKGMREFRKASDMLTQAMNAPDVTNPRPVAPTSTASAEQRAAKEPIEAPKQGAQEQAVSQEAVAQEKTQSSASAEAAEANAEQGKETAAKAGAGPFPMAGYEPPTQESVRAAIEKQKQEG